MDTLFDFRDFFIPSRTDFALSSFLVAFVLTTICCQILRRFYIRYGHSLSNKALFANNFTMLGVTTMLVISVVKSSLALSLGLVGALSIVRFRTAIKEPEELAYLFVVISLGLGFGANQLLVTTLAFALIIATAYLLRRQSAHLEQDVHILSVRGPNQDQSSLEGVTEILKGEASSLELRRVDETAAEYDATYCVAFDSFERLSRAIARIKGLSSDIHVVCLQDRGLPL